jgi:hypothetical protein
VSQSETSSPRVDLRDPYLAALLAWLVPGLGHWYQRRRSKAVLFFLCILGTFGYGLWLGEGRVVYAAWGPTSEDKRLPFLCQAGVGLAAMPALYQAKRFQDEKEYQAVRARAAQGQPQFMDTFMVPPRLDVGPPDELDALNKRLNRRFELGTVYTMVAGLLNLLVIFDAFGGPAYTALGKKSEPNPSSDEKPPSS